MAGAEAWLEMVRRCEREGELFRAYDLAMQGLAEFPDDAGLKHRAVLCLASTGAMPQAAAQFERLFGDGAEAALPSPLALDIASLRARLLKDAALAAAGGDRLAKLAEAAEAYEVAYRKAQAGGNPEAYYPGINCATLHLLGGDEATATRLAREVLGELAAWPAERKTYYEFATEVEACLILVDMPRARATALIARERNLLSTLADFRALSSTIRQLRLIIEARQLDADWLTEMAPPRVIHFVGHIISAPGAGRFPAGQEAQVAAAIAAALDGDDVGFGYGSLAAGADILFAEALLARGAHLNVILPFRRDEFIEVSVRPAGDGWVERFDNCLERAATVRYATEDRYLGDDFLFGYCSQLAMGLALLRARHLLSPVEQIAVWDGRAADAPAGTAHDVTIWRRAGLPQTILPVVRNSAARPAQRAPRPGAGSPPRRRTCAMLFGDVHGFSKLEDEQLPRFVETVLGAFARVLARFADDTLFANTWGDGLFVVFGDAGKAANCALALQAEVMSVDLAAAGLPAGLGLRIGGHFGPAYAARDPILKRRNFFGAHVSRAARIEPVTPENCVYVTETLAAVLALHYAQEFACDYVGMTEAAKNYGKMRMFLLRRVSG